MAVLVLGASSLALPAFLASAAGTAEILADCDVPENSHWKDYLQLWSTYETPDPLSLKQSSWDRLGTQKDRAPIESGLSMPLQRAAFNAAATGHSGDWQQALPITSCGLKLDDEAVSVAVGILLAELYPLCVSLVPVWFTSRFIWP